ncbi:MAG: cysteine desulfurase family protein [Rhodothermia bacterium]|nr:MAG: cysteine desulfurase family protein [Rhodothermia bacterium]
MKKIGSIYLDYAATAPPDSRVVDAMLPYVSEHYGNPSSLHGPGRKARHAVEEARECVAEILGTDPGEIIFTSGGTEADNLALMSAGSSRTYSQLVTSESEHEAVRQTALFLRERGVEVSMAAPDKYGGIDADAINRVLSGERSLVSVMLVNNETGVVNPISEIAETVHASGGVLHTDAVQGAPYYDLKELAGEVDLMTLSGHKMGGPKGIGVLMVRSGTTLDPLLRGGSQERKRRAGTENVAAIVGVAAALEIAQTERVENAQRVRELRDLLRSRLEDSLGKRIRVTTPEHSAPHILHMLALDADGTGVDGEMLILGLDLEGVYVSSGSACTSGALEPSHVLTAMGIHSSVAKGAVRFSLGRESTEEDIVVGAGRIRSVIERVGARVQP